MTSDYGNHFIKAWQQTPNYQLWNDFVDWELLNEIVVPGHPCQGNFSLAHVQRRLAKYESTPAIVLLHNLRSTPCHCYSHVSIFLYLGQIVNSKT